MGLPVHICARECDDAGSARAYWTGEFQTYTTRGHRARRAVKDQVKNLQTRVAAIEKYLQAAGGSPSCRRPRAA